MCDLFVLSCVSLTFSYLMDKQLMCPTASCLNLLAAYLTNYLCVLTASHLFLLLLYVASLICPLFPSFQTELLDLTFNVRIVNVSNKSTCDCFLECLTHL